MSHDVHQKIAKLLRLAKGHGTTPHEAAAAAGRAQALMEQHRLTTADVDESVTGDISEDSTPLWSGNRRVAWVSRLAAALAYLNDCCLLSNSGRKVRFYLAGRPDDIRVVRSLFSYLNSEINRLANESRDTEAFTLWHVSTGKSARIWGSNFRIGAATKIYHRLQADKMRARAMFVADRDAASADRAIVHVEERGASVQRWVDARFENKARPTQPAFDRDARLAGELAGATIVIHDHQRLT